MPPVEVIFPRVDMDMTSGLISRWYVSEGERVEKGQPLFEIETDKAAMEIEAPGSGILRSIVAAADTAVPVGSTVAWIHDGLEAPAGSETPLESATLEAAMESETTGSDSSQSTAGAAGNSVRVDGSVGPIRADAEVPAVAEVPVTEAPPAMARTPAKVRTPAMAETPVLARTATPLARRLAAQHAIRLDRIAGSGPNRRIQARDVVALATADRPAPAAPARSGALHRAWLRTGNGRPLVLVHGFGADLNGWRPFVASLNGELPVLAVDLPGHGRSAAASGPSLEGFAGAVAETLQAEGITAADLIGHSLGAAVAALVTDSATFEAHSLLLISPCGLGPDINGAFIDGFARARSEASLAPWLRLLVSDEAVLGQGFIRALAQQRDQPAVLDALAGTARALFPDGTQAFSIREVLTRLDLPVRVVFGADDRIVPAHHASGLPGSAALHLFRSVGHMPHLEIRSALARIVRDHVR